VSGAQGEYVDNFLTFIELGFRHILPLGLDHILFIVALYLTSNGWRSLLLQVTAFTIAHSTTLGLAAAGVVNVSPAIVEPLIAISIVIVGLEAFLDRKAGRWRLPVNFLFGLCHGLGFAAMMKDYLAGADFLTALVGFNVGVEIGQLAVLALFAALAWGIRTALSGAGRPQLYTWMFTRPVALAIMAAGALWTLQRTGAVGSA
jgi:hydrogenase/urease accessory protein HupE